jgi:putative addiction module component (TIGR02574 family)
MAAGYSAGKASRVKPKRRIITKRQRSREGGLGEIPGTGVYGRNPWSVYNSMRWAIRPERSMNAEFAPLFELSVPQRLRLVEDLWDSIAAAPSSVPVPEWQKEELDRREAEHLQNPAAMLSWEEVKERMLRQND